jgi:FKBP-type peptidyl-prolyl cis-trans isomerase
MKKNLMFLITILFLCSASIAQQNDSDKTDKKEETKKSEVNQAQQEKKQEQEKKETGQSEQTQTQQEMKLEGFIDTNGNGIDDRIETTGKGKGKGKGGKGKMSQTDQFIDLDGDGICDGKESAIGLKKVYRKRKGHQGGK